MFVLDTDMVSLLLRGHTRVTERVAQATEEVALTLISRIEILQGRFASVLKAENSDRLLQAQQRLDESEKDLKRFSIFAIDAASAAEFDRLRQNKKLKKIGRGDLLIAALTLANRATLRRPMCDPCAFRENGEQRHINRQSPGIRLRVLTIPLVLLTKSSAVNRRTGRAGESPLTPTEPCRKVWWIVGLTGK
jgi:tRNA(fMet)-specific endonuclease VapC